MKVLKSKKTFLCLILLFIATFFTSISHAKIDPANVVGLWLFDEGKGDESEDSSGNGNHAILMGRPKWIDGVFGKAIEFDGTDASYANCGNQEILAMTDEVTVQFWFKTYKKMGAFETRQVVVGKHYLEYEVGIYPNGTIHTYTSDGAGNYDEGINIGIAGKLPDGDADWVLDKWYHLSWTLDGAKETVYVNGVKIGEFNKPHEGTKEGIHNLEIGRRCEGSLPFTGAVDEVAVLNVALEEEDVQSSMENGMERALGILAVSDAGKLTTSWGNIKSR